MAGRTGSAAAPALSQASRAGVEIAAANGWVASMTRSMRSEEAASPAAPPNPPIRT